MKTLFPPESVKNSPHTQKKINTGLMLQLYKTKTVNTEKVQEFFHNGANPSACYSPSTPRSKNPESPSKLYPAFKGGPTALHIAAHQGHFQFIYDVYESTQVDLNIRDKEGHSLLHAALAGGRIIYPDWLKFLKFFASHRGDINAQDKNGNTPLHYANQSPEIFKSLLQHGANLNIKNNNGITAIARALEINQHSLQMEINKFAPSPKKKFRLRGR